MKNLDMKSIAVFIVIVVAMVFVAWGVTVSSSGPHITNRIVPKTFKIYSYKPYWNSVNSSWAVDYLNSKGVLETVDVNKTSYTLPDSSVPKVTIITDSNGDSYSNIDYPVDDFDSMHAITVIDGRVK